MKTRLPNLGLEPMLCETMGLEASILSTLPQFPFQFSIKLAQQLIHSFMLFIAWPTNIGHIRAISSTARPSTGLFLQHFIPALSYVRLVPRFESWMPMVNLPTQHIWWRSANRHQRYWPSKCHRHTDGWSHKHFLSLCR